MARILGVLGGMGPLATVDFLNKIIRATPARFDQEHLPVITACLPQIPDRNEAIMGAGLSPLSAMADALRRLEWAGVSAIAIPCNTAHLWHGDLQRKTQLPILHIVGTTINLLQRRGVRAGCRVGLLATSSTLEMGIYRDRLTAVSMTCIDPDIATQENSVMAGIRAVKAGNIECGAERLIKAADHLRALGAEKIILACTEIPLALSYAGYCDETVIDATDALAIACVDWAGGIKKCDVSSVEKSLVA